MAFGLWDIAQIGIPLAANIVAPGVGGIVASGAMGAGGAALKGKKLQDILKAGALGAGTAALGAKAGDALSGMASEGGNLLAKKGVKSAAQKGFGLGLDEEMARKGSSLALGAVDGAGRAGAGLGIKDAGRFMKEAGDVADKTASKVRFLEHMQELGGAGAEMKERLDAERARAAADRARMNYDFMASTPRGTQYGLSPWVPGRY
jgi:hypothetical protein